MKDFEGKVELLLQKFHNSRPDFESQIGEWRNEYRKAIIAVNLQENPVIKDFCSKLFDEIEGINYRLQNERLLKEDVRERLLDKRSLFEEFLYCFVGAQKKIASIEHEIEKNL